MLRWCVSVSLVVLLGFGCGRGPVGSEFPSSPSELRLARPSEIEVWGCATWIAPSTCELDARRRLVVVVPDAVGPVEVLGPAERPLPVGAQIVEGALTATATIPESWDEIRVRAGGRSRSVRLKAARALVPAVASAEALRRSGAASDGEVTALLGLTLNSTDAWVRATAHGTRARALRAADKYREARQSFAESARAYAAAGRDAQAATEELTAAYVLLEHEARFQEAETTIESVRSRSLVSPEVQLSADYYAALLASYRFELAAAIDAARSVRRRARRGQVFSLVSAALQVEARVIGENLGQVEEALALLDEARTNLTNTHPCVRLALELNEAWLLILRVQADSSDRHAGEAATRALDSAEFAVRHTCPSASGVSLVLTHRAVLAVSQGDADGAARALARSATVSPGGAEPNVWRREVEAQAALARGDVSLAVEGFRAAERLAQDLEILQARWRALSGLARAYALAKKHKRALDALARAEAMADDLVFSAPLGEGRDHFLASMERTTRFHVDYLLSRRDLREAARVARRAQARGLLALQVRDRLARQDKTERAWNQQVEQYRRARLEVEAGFADAWHLSVRDRELLARRQAESYHALQVAADNARMALRDALSPCGPPRSETHAGDLEMVFHPTEDGVTVIADGQTRLQLPAAALADPIALGDAVASRLDSELDRSHRVRLMVPSSLNNIDLAAMRWRGLPLGRQKEVIYGADLPRCGPEPGPGRRAVIVRPSASLEHAEREATAAKAALEAQGLEVEQLPLDAATHGNVLAALAAPDVGWVHFVGHSTFGGPDGTSSGLVLARGSILGVADILGLPRVPEVVVLSGCETARTSTRSTALGLGVAHAFLAAGASQVLATARPVADGPSYRLMAAFYASRGGSVGERLRDAWRAEPDNTEMPSQRAMSRW